MSRLKRLSFRLFSTRKTHLIKHPRYSFLIPLISLCWKANMADFKKSGTINQEYVKQRVCWWEYSCEQYPSLTGCLQFVRKGLQMCEIAWAFFFSPGMFQLLLQYCVSDHKHLYFRITDVLAGISTKHIGNFSRMIDNCKQFLLAVITVTNRHKFISQVGRRGGGN